MSTLISSFHNVIVALKQDQLALTATADNISNQNTAGYARRVVTWSGGDTVTLNGATSVQPSTAFVTAQRNSVLDTTVVGTTANSASAGTLKAAMNDLQSVFAIDATGDEGSGISVALSSFFSAMQSVASNPAGTEARQSALAAAQAVASSFRSTSLALSQQSANLDSNIESAVGAVNSLTSSIAELNGRIAAAATIADRDTLTDQRAAQVETLAQLIGVQQTASSDGTISLFTSNGGALVVGSMDNALSSSVVAGALHLFVQGKDVTAGLTGGSVGGSLVARDGALADISSRVDALAVAFATAVNAANANGITGAGTAGQPIFSIGTSGSHTAAEIGVAIMNSGGFAAAASDEGSGGNQNANAMAMLGAEASGTGNTFAGALSAAISSIGIAAASAEDTASTASAALTQANTNQESVSGVSLDTEAANLTQYQRSYQAEAKLLSVLNQIMADAINLGTNTAVS